MRKIVALFMAFTMSVLFTACGTSQNSSSSEPESSSSKTVSSKVLESSSAQSSVESSENNSEADSSQIAENEEFNLTQSKYVSIMDKWLKSQNIGLLSDIIPSRRTENYREVGTVDCYKYQLEGDSGLTLRVDKTNNNIANISLFADPVQLEKQGNKTRYYYLMTGTLSYMAGDDAQSTYKELEMDNITKANSTVAIANDCVFSYIVTDAMVTLSIRPSSK